MGATFCYSASGAGQQCCYSKPTNGEPGTILPYKLSNGQLAGGTYDRAHYKGNLATLKVPVIDHVIEDVVPFEWCCKDVDSSNCDKYGELRPSDDCSDYVPPRPGRELI